MSTHIITISIVVEIPDGECHDADVDALEAATELLLEDGTVQADILDHASTCDDASGEVQAITAFCTVQEMTENAP